MKLGILQCDSVPAEWVDEFGDYPDMFQRLLTTADPTLTFDVYNLSQDAFPAALDDCDGWLFTGSRCGANDDEAWIRQAETLVTDLHRQRRPTIGICFGHQLIARALGGRVEKASGWGVGVHTTQILEQREWMEPPAAELSLLVSHQDQVVELPPGAIHLASHLFCRYDMYQVDQHILTFQGHPEFAKGYSRATMERRRERLGEQTFQSGIKLLAQDTDGAIAAAWIVRFLKNNAASSNQEKLMI